MFGGTACVATALHAISELAVSEVLGYGFRVADISGPRKTWGGEVHTRVTTIGGETIVKGLH